MTLQNSEGKYKLECFTLSTPTKPLDLSGMAISCDIYENILSPSAICVVKIYDATGLFSKLNFSEQDLCVSWTTNESGPGIHYKFKILECTPAKTINDGKGVLFTITGVNEESFKSRTIKDFQLIRNKIEAITVVNLIMDATLDSKKPRFFEPTKGLHTFNKTNINPLEAINSIRRVSISTKYDGSAFVFFENHRGLHYKSIEKLIDDGKKNIGDKVFFNTPTAKLSTTSGSNWRNILAYKTIQNGNQSVLLATGGAKVKVQYFDIKSQKIFGEITRISSDFNFVKLNDGTDVGSIRRAEEITKDAGRVIQLLYNPDQDQNQLIDKMAAEACYLAEFLSVINHITIYGDSEIAAGDVITCHFRESTGLTAGDKTAYIDDNPTTSGNYLVAKCRHVLTFGDTPEYYQGLEIIKDGVYSPLKAIS